MPQYLEIAVNVPQVSGAFHYHLPPELEGRIRPGHLVSVPFGSQTVQGVVLRDIDAPEVSQTRPVLELVDPDTTLTLEQITLARQLAHQTLSPLSACIWAMLPPGLGQQADSLYSLEGQPAFIDRSWGRFNSIQKRLVGLLRKRGPLRGRQIDKALPHIQWRPSARSLVKRGLLSSQPVLPPPTARPKTIRTVQLAVSAQDAEQALPDLGRAGSAALKRRQIMLRRISSEALPVEAAWLYAESGGNLADLRKLEQMGLVRLDTAETWRDPLTDIDPLPATPPPLTRDQAEIWSILRESLQQAVNGKPQKPFLLHGVTGSGKTEIYLQAVGETLRLGRQAIILVPEIALTPQTVRRFLARFPGRVGLLHSGLSEGERYDTWRRARLGELDVIVGPRSALFSPLQRIGLIVVDESHDTTYYQSDTLPHYHAREAAVLYASLCGAVCLLGSATPQITSRYRADRGEWRYLSLPDRILAHKQTIQAQLKRIAAATQAASHYLPFDSQAESIQLPPVQVVDMRAELKAGNRSIFSLALQAALDRVLQANQQAILFLNRRGAATYVFCRDCGYSLKCPQCEIPLTMHGKALASPTLICHHCGYQRKSPARCPQCGSKRIRHYGTGTERVESEVIDRFPGVRTLRWDYETTRQKGAHEAILNHFANHHADILIGTQMIAKGLDLPLVTLVGVVLADVGLNLPDAFAPERTFQTLTQVSGRAGRSPLGGEVILQTFQPEHYIIQAAAGHDYQAFYRQELLYRAPLEYPPFGNLVRLEYRHTDANQAERAARSLADQIHAWIQEEERASIHLAGPVPCFFARLAGQYRWQIVLHGPDPAALLRGRQFNDWRIEVNPPSLL